MRREKRLKEWQRQWKIDLIEKNNPNWIDLYSKYNGLILWIPRSSRGMTKAEQGMTRALSRPTHNSKAMLHVR